MFLLCIFHQFLPVKTLQMHVPGDPLPDIQPVHIHTDGVAQLLLNLKSHKAAGPDNLPSNFLKEVANEITPALSGIFQASLNQGVLPIADVWKSALV